MMPMVWSMTARLNAACKLSASRWVCAGSGITAETRIDRHGLPGRGRADAGTAHDILRHAWAYLRHRVPQCGLDRAGRAALAAQLTTQLPNGQVAWTITDPIGTGHRGTNTLNSRLDLLTIAVDELVDDLYNQLHRAADGGLTPPVHNEGRSGHSPSTAKPRPGVAGRITPGPRPVRG
jgi:hypothetical protein